MVMPHNHINRDEKVVVTNIAMYNNCLLKHFIRRLHFGGQYRLQSIKCLGIVLRFNGHPVKSNFHVNIHHHIM